MAWENKTLSEIETDYKNGFTTSFNTNFQLLKKSFISLSATVNSGIYITLHKLIGWFYLQTMPSTATYDEITVLGHTFRPLVALGDQFGVSKPLTGNAWEGLITITVVTPGETLETGTQLQSGVTGKIYLVNDSTVLAGSTMNIAIKCTETGTSGNLSAGDGIDFVTNLGIVKQSATVLSTTTSGTDEEDKEEYRARVQTRYKNPPKGGALADYRIWGNEVDGVSQIYPYKDTDTASGVLIYVAGDSATYTNRIPDTALLLAVGKMLTYDPDTGLATRKPLCATIDPVGDETYTNVKPVTIKTFDVYVVGISGVDADDFATAVKSTVENYLLGREPYIRGLSDDNNKTNQITKNSISSEIDQVAITIKATFDSVILKGASGTVASYELGQGELAKLGTLYIDGTAY